MISVRKWSFRFVCYPRLDTFVCPDSELYVVLWVSCCFVTLCLCRDYGYDLTTVNRMDSIAIHTENTGLTFVDYPADSQLLIFWWWLHFQHTTPSHYLLYILIMVSCKLQCEYHAQTFRWDSIYYQPFSFYSFPTCLQRLSNQIKLSQSKHLLSSSLLISPIGIYHLNTSVSQHQRHYSCEVTEIYLGDLICYFKYDVFISFCSHGCHTFSFRLLSATESENEWTSF